MIWNESDCPDSSFRIIGIYHPLASLNSSMNGRYLKTQQSLINSVVGK